MPGADARNADVSKADVSDAEPLGCGRPTAFACRTQSQICGGGRAEVNTAPIWQSAELLWATAKMVYLDLISLKRGMRPNLPAHLTISSNDEAPTIIAVP
jgi:hypothetical protein